MNRIRPAMISSLVLLSAALALPSSSLAAPTDPSGFHFLSSQLHVDEAAGNAVITVTRTDSSRGAQVRYITIGVTAQAPYDYKPVKSVLDFAAGQANATFDVPIVDHNVVGAPKTIQVSLFGPSPIGLATPSTATLTINYNDPVVSTDPTNPLGLAAATIGGDPLTGATFYVDPNSEAANAARSDPRLRVIAEQPGTARFGAFSYPNAGVAVSRYLSRAAVQQANAVPMLTTYRLVDGHCGQWADPPADVASYQTFINGFAQGIGSYKAVLFLEQDSLITTGCLSKAGLAIRLQELNYAIDTLAADCPHLVIYLDAGAADAVPAATMAHLLNEAGISKIQGFFVDATHFDWTSKEISYGNTISQMTSGKHFVVSTGESGRGPEVPANRVTAGNEVLCNPSGRGLGPKPTTNTGFRLVDAFAWLDNPGGSSGACVPGAPKTGVYWPAYADGLVKNANFTALGPNTTFVPPTSTS